jgi:hypothetical protein
MKTYNLPSSEQFEIPTQSPLITLRIGDYLFTKKRYSGWQIDPWHIYRTAENTIIAAVTKYDIKGVLVVFKDKTKMFYKDQDIADVATYWQSR